MIYLIGQTEANQDNLGLHVEVWVKSMSSLGYQYSCANRFGLDYYILDTKDGKLTGEACRSDRYQQFFHHSAIRPARYKMSAKCKPLNGNRLYLEV
jgi:hypothetical protein